MILHHSTLMRFVLVHLQDKFQQHDPIKYPPTEVYINHGKQSINKENKKLIGTGI